jgi:NDP-hexose 4-ketoreductase
MSERIAVLGGSGWMGRALLGRLRGRAPGIELLAPSRELLDRADRQGLRALLRPDPELAVVNLAGARRGEPHELAEVNADLPARLVDALADSGARLVHLGSAAEYGDPGSSAPVREDQPARPAGEYGRTKLAGTLAVLGAPRSCVLRPFNIVDRHLPEGSVVAEILGKIARAREGGGEVELLSAQDVRDYVSLDFVLVSILHALDSDAAGLFNVCSGTGVSYESLTIALAGATGGTLPVRDRGEPGIRAVVGDPTAWQRASGLAEHLAPTDIARIVTAG